MKPSLRIAVAALAAVFISLIVHARPPQAVAEVDASADLLVEPARQRAGLRVPGASGAAPAAVDPDDIYDADSFGRALRWLGSVQMNIALADTCPAPVPGTTVGSACATLRPAPEATDFAFDDVARVNLPRGASHSLLCHWFSPYLGLTYHNPDPSAAATGRLWYSPTLTIENPLLDDPSLIDLATGQPFNGRLTTSLSNYELFEVPLAPGAQLSMRERDTAACIAGFVSRRGLVATHGLTEAQARRFFRQPMTIRMNIRGSAQYVSNANMIFGMRIVGD